MKLKLFPEDIIQENDLRNKVDAMGNIHCKVQQGMYGLPQVGIIAQELLEEQLLKAGYCQSKVTPGYWKHDWQSISFILVMNNFSVKYINKNDATHLIQTLSKTRQLRKTGKRLGNLASHLTETTGNTKSTSPCPAMLNKHLPNLDILSPNNLNINLTNILFPPTEPQFNMPKLRIRQHCFQKKTKSTSNR